MGRQRRITLTTWASGWRRSPRTSRRWPTVARRWTSTPRPWAVRSPTTASTVSALEPSSSTAPCSQPSFRPGRPASPSFRPCGSTLPQHLPAHRRPGHAPKACRMPRDTHRIPVGDRSWPRHRRAGAFTDDASFAARGQELHGRQAIARFLEERQAETERHTVHALANEIVRSARANQLELTGDGAAARTRSGRKLRHPPRPEHHPGLPPPPRPVENP